MIKTKSELTIYMADDAKHYPEVSSCLGRLKHSMVTNPINCKSMIYKYLRNLRYAEYHQNNSVLMKLGGVKSWCHTILLTYYYYKLRKLSYNLGFQIPPNTCGPGILIYHYGYLVINPNARIGSNVVLYPGVEIGDKNGCPIIGDNVFIGAGAKIFGPITIGNNVTIGPNAVVVKDVPDNAIVGGVPAKIIRIKNESPANKHPL